MMVVNRRGITVSKMSGAHEINPEPRQGLSVCLTSKFYNVQKLQREHEKLYYLNDITNSFE